MFEEQINLWKQDILDKINLNDEFILFKDIIQIERLPSYVRKYFNAEIKRWIFEENKYFHENPNYNLSSSAIDSINFLLNEKLKNSAKVNEKELDLLVESCVKIRLNYLCRPLTTIKWFVFRGEVIKPIEEIKILLEFFEDYNYLLNSISNWLEEAKARNDSQINYDDFEKELERIDFEIVNDFSFEDFTEMVIPLISFFNSELVINNETEFPIEALIMFLDDKHINTIAEKLEQLFFDESQFYISQKKLIDVLNDYIIESKMNSDSQKINSFESCNDTINGLSDDKPDYELLIVDEDLTSDVIADSLINDKKDKE